MSHSRRPGHVGREGGNNAAVNMAEEDMLSPIDSSIPGAEATVAAMQASLESLGLLAAYNHVLREIVNRRTKIPSSHLFEFAAREFERFGARWERGMVDPSRVSRDVQRRKRQMRSHMTKPAQQNKLQKAQAAAASRMALQDAGSPKPVQETEAQHIQNNTFAQDPMPHASAPQEPKFQESASQGLVPDSPDLEEATPREASSATPESLNDAGGYEREEVKSTMAKSAEEMITTSPASLDDLKQDIKRVASNVVNTALTSSMTPRKSNTNDLHLSDAKFILKVVEHVMFGMNVETCENERENILDESSDLSEGSDLSVIQESNDNINLGDLSMSSNGTQ